MTEKATCDCREFTQSKLDCIKQRDRYFFIEHWLGTSPKSEQKRASILNCLKKVGRWFYHFFTILIGFNRLKYNYVGKSIINRTFKWNTSIILYKFIINWHTKEKPVNKFFPRTRHAIEFNSFTENDKLQRNYLDERNGSGCSFDIRYNCFDGHLDGGN